jgi:hypothetical protein
MRAAARRRRGCRRSCVRRPTRCGTERQGPRGGPPAPFPTARAARSIRTRPGRGLRAGRSCHLLPVVSARAYPPMVDAVRPPSSADARAKRPSGRAGACRPAPASRGTWEFNEGQSTSPLLLSAVAQSTAGCTPIRRPHQSIVPATAEPSSNGWRAGGWRSSYPAHWPADPTPANIGGSVASLVRWRVQSAVPGLSGAWRGVRCRVGRRLGRARGA